MLRHRRTPNLVSLGWQNLRRNKSEYDMQASGSGQAPFLWVMCYDKTKRQSFFCT